MLRPPPLQTFPPETLSLDELVPKNHLVRQVDAAEDRAAAGKKPEASP